MLHIDWNSAILHDIQQSLIYIMIDTIDIQCKCENCDLKDLFFGHVDSQALSQMCETRTETKFDKGQVIIQEGDPIENFIYLKSGLVKLFRTDDIGKSQIIAIGKPLDFVSLLSAFSEGAYKYSVTAIEASITCELPMEMIRVMAAENGKFAMDVIRKLSRATDSIIIDFLEIRKKHLRGRVAHVLLMFSKDIYHDSRFELPISRKEIAEVIGMTPENVIRTLSEFRKDGLINIFGKLIEVQDNDRLETISLHG
jgi:CRP-like cAMP-binding protein